MGHCGKLDVETTMELRDGVPYCGACGEEILIHGWDEEKGDVLVSVRDWRAEQDRLEGR